MTTPAVTPRSAFDQIDDSGNVKPDTTGTAFDALDANGDPPADGGTVQPGVLDSQGLQPGEQLNEVGNKVIVPTAGESFSDTLQRAVRLGKARQAAGTQSAAISKETATIPSKTVQTLGAAATAGIAGPATLALPGELGASLPSLTAAVKAVGAWAEKHPVHAYLVFQALKELMPGAKKASAIIKAIPGE